MFVIDNQIDKEIIEEYYNRISRHYDTMVSNGFPPMEWYPTRNIPLLNNDKLVRKVKKIIESNLRVKLTLHSAELQTWPIDSFSPAHTHERRDKEEDFNSLLYLNDDFEGGIFYADTGINIQPVTGRLTFFDGKVIPHGVSPVKAKHRHTAIFWWKETKMVSHDTVDNP